MKTSSITKKTADDIARDSSDDEDDEDTEETVTAAAQEPDETLITKPSSAPRVKPILNNMELNPLPSVSRKDETKTIEKDETDEEPDPEPDPEPESDDEDADEE